MSKRIIQNEVQCGSCGDVIFSRNRHDFVTCTCGNISVDGGMDYIRRVGGEKGYTELSMFMDEKHLHECRKAVKWAEDNGRNDLGKVFAVLRTLQDFGLLNEKEFKDADGDA